MKLKQILSKNDENLLCPLAINFRSYKKVCHHQPVSKRHYKFFFKIELQK